MINDSAAGSKDSLKDCLHGKIFTYAGESSIKECLTVIKRQNILDKKKSAEINDQIKTNKEILFLPNTIKEFHEKDSNNRLVYRLFLCGILQDGRKAGVILEDINPYFEVRKPDNLTEYGFRKKVKSIVDEKSRNSFIGEIYARGFNRYEKDPTLYVRVYSYTIWDRKRLMEYFIDTLEYTTTTDDKSHYERVVCRSEAFSMCTWNTIKFKSNNVEPIGKLDTIFRVHLKDMCAFQGDITQDDSLAFDKTLVKTWDIEAHTDRGEMPDAENDDDNVFAIGQTYHWKYSKESLLDVCLVTCPCDPRPDKLTIYCTSEKDLIKASFLLDKYLQPDYMIGFNDGDFDWPFILKKAVKNNCLLDIYNNLSIYRDYRRETESKKDQIESIIKWDCRKQKIKLDAENSAYSTTMTLPGIINIDVRSIFRKLHNTKTKSSLKFYLSLHDLGGKEDMPIPVMFRIYRESRRIAKDISDLTSSKEKPDPVVVKKLMEELTENKKRMADVAHYCMIDAKRCQELIHKLNVISDKREVSDIAHTSLYDAIYYADGMKVRNLVIAEAQKCGYLLSTRSKPYIGDGKYPGAYVFNPKQGPVKPKRSIRERIYFARNHDKPNKHYDSNDNVVDSRWQDVPEEDVKKMQEAIYKHMGVHVQDVDEKLEHVSTENPTGSKSDTECDYPITHEYIADYVDDFKYKHSKGLFTKFLKERNRYPISGLDFSSLYPSLIMAYNLTPEYMLFTEKDKIKAEGDGHTVHKIDFEFNGSPIVAWSIRHDTIDGKELQPGKTENKFGMYPTILKSLFDKRAQMKVGLKKFSKEKERMEKEGLQDTSEFARICFSYNYIDAKQKALKVFMNTFYGETGNKLSPFFVLAIAGGITSAGQRNIKMIAELMQKNGSTVVGESGDTDANGYRVYYGDSVTGDTPLLIKRGSEVDIVTIKDLFKYEGKISSYGQFKPYDKTLIEKEKSEIEGLKIWTHQGWSDIKKVIRHKTNKKIYRVNTRTGCIDVTEDHSLLNTNIEQIKPKDAVIGSELLHGFPFKPEDLDPFYEFKINTVYTPTTIEEQKAYIYGFFYGDGSCDEHTWTLNNKNPEVINTLLQYLSNVYQTEFKTLETLEPDLVYKIVPCCGDIKSYFNEYRPQFYNENYKKVPTCILNADTIIKHVFMLGYRQSKNNGFSNKGKIGTQGLYYLCKSLGYTCSIQISRDRPEIYSINNRPEKPRKSPNVIENIYDMGFIENEFVYDIETAAGTFHCGVGEMIVKNTDSVYISCPDRHFVGLDRQYYSGKIEKEDYCTQLVKETFKQIEVGKKLANNTLIADNGTKFLKMAYEEVLFPAIFLLRKMYSGIEHQSIVNFHPRGDELFYRGLALKKRGSSDVLKTVCMEVMLEILDIHNTKELITIIKDKIGEVYERKWELSDFKKDAVFKPSKQNIAVRTFVKRMEERNDINCPVPVAGERFDYVVVKKYPFKYDMQGRKTALSVAEKWEYYTYVKDNDLEIDLHYYMEGGIIGQFAQLIVYYPEFRMKPEDDSDEAQDVAIKKSLNNAKKYIINMCKSIAKFPDCQGPVLKKLYKIADKSCKALDEKYQEPTDIPMNTFSAVDIYQAMKNSIDKDIKKISDTYAVQYVDFMVKKYGAAVVFILHKLFNGKDGLFKLRQMYVIKAEDTVRAELYDHAKYFKQMFATRESAVNDLIHAMKKGLGLDDIESSAFQQVLPGDLQISSNQVVADIMEGKGNICEKYDAFLEEFQDYSNKIQKLYSTLRAAMVYKANAKSIIERLQFSIDELRKDNAKPPGVVEELEVEQAKSFIRANLIDF